MGCAGVCSTRGRIYLSRGGNRDPRTGRHGRDSTGTPAGGPGARLSLPAGGPGASLRGSVGSDLCWIVHLVGITDYPSPCKHRDRFFLQWPEAKACVRFGQPEYISSSEMNCVTQLQVIEWMIVLQKRSCTSMIIGRSRQLRPSTTHFGSDERTVGAGARSVHIRPQPSAPIRTAVAERACQGRRYAPDPPWPPCTHQPAAAPVAPAAPTQLETRSRRSSER